MDEILEISNLTYEEDGEKLFDELNLVLNYNEWYSLISEDSNPTTLVKIISGLITNYDGEIEFNFLKLNQENLYEIRTRMSILFGDLDSQILHTTVYDELVFELDNMQYGKDLKEQFINDINKCTNVKDIIDKKISDLTEEEKYTVLLAAALIIKPKLLVIDETFSSLSKTTRKKLYDMINIYKENNKLTVLNITNNLEDTLIGNNIIYLQNGKIVFNEKVTKVYDESLITDDVERLPFIIRFSEYLKLYNLSDKNYYDLEEMVADLWK